MEKDGKTERDGEREILGQIRKNRSTLGQREREKVERDRTRL